MAKYIYLVYIHYPEADEATPIYFDNEEAAKTFAKRDYTSKPIKIEVKTPFYPPIMMHKSTAHFDSNKFYWFYG